MDKLQVSLNTLRSRVRKLVHKNLTGIDQITVGIDSWCVVVHLWIKSEIVFSVYINYENNDVVPSTKQILKVVKERVQEYKNSQS